MQETINEVVLVGWIGREGGIAALGLFVGMIILAGGVGGAISLPITSCTEINSSGVYTLTANITDSSIPAGLSSWSPNACIKITTSNVVLDGQDLIVDGLDTAWTVGERYQQRTMRSRDSPMLYHSPTIGMMPAKTR